MATTIDFIVKNGLLVQGVGSSVSTSTGTGALVVNGGAGFNGDIHALNIFANNAEVLTTSTIENYDKIVHSITPGTDISVNTTTNYVTINVTSTLQTVTDRGSSTTNLIEILNNTSATSTSSGALTVVGGMGIGGDAYIGGNLVVNGTINATITGVISTATNLDGGAVNNVPFQSGAGQTTFSNDLIYNNSTKQFSVGLANIWGNTSLGYELSSITNVTISADAGNSIQLFSDTEAVLNYNNSATVRANFSGVELAVGSKTLDWDYNGILSINGSNETADFLGAGALKLAGGAYIGNNVYVVNGLSASSLTGRNLTNGRVTYTSGGQLADSPHLLYDNIILTVPGLGTTGTISINNPTQSTNSLTGALIVDGGVGVGGNLNVGGSFQVWGPTTFGDSVVFNGTTTYVLSTNTVYTDNILELHTTGTVNTPWTFDDGKDIGLRFHYYNRTLNTGTNAALVLANDTQWLEWYGSGAEGTSTFSGYTYGGFKTGEIWVVSTSNATTSTNSGAFSVGGGASIAQDLWVGGDIYQGGDRVVTETQLSTATVTKIEAGTGISVSTVTGVVVISSTATLQNVTDQDATTTNAIRINNNTTSSSTNTGALIVAGGAGIGNNLTVGGIIQVGTSSGTAYGDNNLIRPTAASSFLNLKGGGGYSKISIGNSNVWISSGLTSPIIFTTNASSSTNGGVEVMRITSDFRVGIGTTSPSAKLSVDGTMSVTGITTVSNTTAATNTETGALQVAGGVGVGGNLYASRIFDGGVRVLTNVMPSGGTAIDITDITTSNGTVSFTINNTGVTSLIAGTDTAVSSSSGSVTVWNNSTLQSVTDRGSSTTNVIYISNATTASTYTGALVVDGGVGISGDLWIGGTFYSSGQAVLTTSSFVNSSSAGDDIKITEGTSGTIVISNTSTLQTVTNRGATTTNVINFANTTSASSTESGAVTIAGGVGIGENLYVGGTIVGTVTTANNAFLAASATTVSIVAQDENSTYYPTFVNSNNDISANELVYTTSSFVINPSTGRVGIGTTTPGYSVDIFNATGGKLFRAKDSDSTYDGLIISGDANGSYVGNRDIGTGLGESIYFQNNINALRFYTTGTERIRITNNGNVGIGTASPTSLLHVSGTTLLAGITTVTNATVSTASTSGAFQVVGGVGIGGQLNVGGSTSTFVGSIIVGTSTIIPNWRFYVSGNAFVSADFSAAATTGAVSLGHNQTTGNWIAGGERQTGIITLGRSTLTQVVSIANGAVSAGNTKTVNIGTNGLPGSNTIISMGTTATTSTIILNGNVVISKTVADPASITVDTSPITLDSFLTTEYRSAKYFISISNTVSNLYQTTEIWLVQDGVSAHIEQTSVFSSGTNVVAFTTDVTAGTVSLIALGANSNNQIKVQSTYITV